MSEDFTTPPVKTSKKSAPQVQDVAPKEDAAPPKEVIKDKKIFSEQELENFWISLMNKEPYKEEIKHRGMKAILASPTDKDKAEIEMILDTAGIRTTAAYDALETRLLIAATVLRCGSYVVSGKDSLQARLEKLKEVPLPLYDLMLRFVMKFNAKILAMLDEVTKDDFFGEDSQ